MLLNLLFKKNNLKKCIMVFTKILSSTTVFNIDNNKNVFELQISILEWFPKDHVTLKTEVIMLKIQLYITGINYNLKYIKIENSYFKL